MSPPPLLPPRRAPSLITSKDHPKARDALWADAVDAVVAPATAFGGAGVLSLAEQVRRVAMRALAEVACFSF